MDHPTPKPSPEPQDAPGGLALSKPALARAPSSKERNLALIAHGAGLLTSFTALGFVPPLIIWRLAKGQLPFAAQEALEALNFQLTLALAIFVSALLLVVVLGFFMAPVVWVWGFLFSAHATLSVYKGRAYQYPLSIAFIRER